MDLAVPILFCMEHPNDTPYVLNYVYFTHVLFVDRTSLPSRLEPVTMVVILLT